MFVFCFVLHFFVLFCFSLISTDARWHNHANHKRSHHHHLGSYISLPLSPSPTSEPAETPEELEPEPDPPHSSTDVFDVRHFGAVGDGITDDTESFKMAWDTACQSNSLSVIFVPYGFSFMIQRGIMLQVMVQFLVWFGLVFFLDPFD